MNRTFRALAVGFLVLGSAFLPVACSSGTSGGYGDLCTVYSVDAPCTTGLDCRCRSNGCFCANQCLGKSDCPGKYDECVDGTNPATGSTGTYCFQFKADGGPLYP
jgi:hypothetical protein